MIDKSVGQRIRQLREAADLSPDELAEKAGPEGPSASTIARIEAGRVIPSGIFSETIAKALNVSLEYLKTGYDKRQGPVAKLAEARLRKRLYNPNLVEEYLEEVQEYLEEFVSSAKFRNQNLSDLEFLGKKVDEYLDLRERQDEIRAFSLGGENDPI